MFGRAREPEWPVEASRQCLLWVNDGYGRQADGIAGAPSAPEIAGAFRTYASCKMATKSLVKTEDAVRRLNRLFHRVKRFRIAKFSYHGQVSCNLGGGCEIRFFGYEREYERRQMGSRHARRVKLTSVAKLFTK